MNQANRANLRTDHLKSTEPGFRLSGDMFPFRVRDDSNVSTAVRKRSDFEDLLNGKQLAAALGRTDNFATAMKQAGYRFQYPGCGKTSLRHALEALNNEDFVANHYLTPGWELLPKCLAAKQNQKA